MRMEINDADGRANYLQRLIELGYPGQVLSSGRIKEKNAGEVSITILAEVVSWYYPYYFLTNIRMC